MTQTEAAQALELLQAIKELSEIDKILSTFISSFYNHSIESHDNHWLHGSFRLGGTKSGRLSSAHPNIQQLPSTGTKYAKDIKQCFKAPEGWLLVGADFSSLEDRISALVTKDPNKLKLYTDGYDGHSLRAYSYFHDQMPDIDPDSVESINSIAVKYPKLRQDSKTPTFALTYMGTFKTLMKNGGFSEKEAKKIEANYHKLYAVSDQWTKEQIDKASKTGYVELAFGLKLRTPILPQVLLDSGRSLPNEAYKEVKTAANALIQSYGLLNTRAVNAFMEKVWKSKHKHDIKPIAQIHDAAYFVIRDDPEVLEFTNKHLIEEMQWNDLEALKHPTVGLEAELEVYTPNWSVGVKATDLLQEEHDMNADMVKAAQLINQLKEFGFNYEEKFREDVIKQMEDLLNEQFGSSKAKETKDQSNLFNGG